MKQLFITGLLITTTFFVFGQNAEGLINTKEVERIEKVLSADDMMGRKTFTPYIDK
ncbi:MAG: aminopeptidase, partial [Chitinophagaceae bacterium]